MSLAGNCIRLGLLVGDPYCIVQPWTRQQDNANTSTQISRRGRRAPRADTGSTTPESRRRTKQSQRIDETAADLRHETARTRLINAQSGTLTSLHLDQSVGPSRPARLRLGVCKCLAWLMLVLPAHVEEHSRGCRARRPSSARATSSEPVTEERCNPSAAVAHLPRIHKHRSTVQPPSQAAAPPPLSPVRFTALRYRGSLAERSLRSRKSPDGASVRRCCTASRGTQAAGTGRLRRREGTAGRQQSSLCLECGNRGHGLCRPSNTAAQQAEGH